ncbi:hypothetical protein O6W96_07315 [Sphingomonas faeni]
MADEIQVMDACDRLIDLAIWPRGKIEYRGWLANFDRADRPLAVQMLSRFTFLSHALVDRLFVSAFHDVSNFVGSRGQDFPTRQSLWQAFCAQAIVVPVMGENPNPSDSGWGFARKARQLLGIPEGNLMQPQEAVEAVASGSSAPVVFVDDFVGSGDQFLRTWRRRHETTAGTWSFAQLAGRMPVFYCNVFMTQYGRNRIARAAPTVRLVTGNMIPLDHNHISSDSVIWTKAQGTSGIRLARRIGHSLGYTATNGGLRDWRGYHKLGLGIAMEDSVPDANLPLFFEDANGWQPLVRRS